MKIRITAIEEVLGSSPSNEDLLGTYIASKAPNEELSAQEVETIRPELEQTLHAPTYYTIKQVADMMSVSPDTITRRINAGCCGPDGVIELGGRRRITEQGLAALEAACRWKFA